MAVGSELQQDGSKSGTSAPRNKVVIRRLPPTLPEETFWKSVESWVTENTCLWKRYVKGRAPEGNDGHAIFSRAYVLLSSSEVVTDFHRGYDGHVFRAKSGEEFQAVVELAPVQKTPYKAKVKVDARQGTIDSEPDYLSFLESLKSPPEKPILEVSGPISQPTTTPLLEHLRTHGRSGKGSKGKDRSTAASSSDATAKRAIASVNAAAAKRAPNANSGPILVAGKGRATSMAVNTTKNEEITTENAEGKKKRNRNKGKSAKPPGEGGGPSLATQSQGQTQQGPGKSQNNAPRAPRSDWAPPEKSDSGAVESGKTSGGRGGGGGGRSNRGGRGGKGEGKDRTPRAAVTSILTKNAEGESTRGGGGTQGGRGRGRGRGRGGHGGSGGESGPGGVPSLAAASARIDG